MNESDWDALAKSTEEESKKRGYTDRAGVFMFATGLEYLQDNAPDETEQMLKGLEKLEPKHRLAVVYGLVKVSDLIKLHRAFPRSKSIDRVKTLEQDSQDGVFSFTVFQDNTMTLIRMTHRWQQPESPPMIPESPAVLERLAVTERMGFEVIPCARCGGR